MGTVTILNVRKIEDKSTTAQICKQDLSLWQKDGWELYGAEETREQIVVNITTATSTDTFSSPSISSPSPKIDTVTLTAELSEKEFCDIITSDIINAKLATAMYRAGIKSKAQLISTSDEKLLAIPGLGRAKIKDIRDALRG
jgi:hypothetical protein